jgi:hypothetical protein
MIAPEWVSRVAEIKGVETMRQTMPSGESPHIAGKRLPRGRDYLRPEDVRSSPPASVVGPRFAMPFSYDSYLGMAFEQRKPVWRAGPNSTSTTLVPRLFPFNE